MVTSGFLKLGRRSPLGGGPGLDPGFPAPAGYGVHRKVLEIFWERPLEVPILGGGPAPPLVGWGTPSSGLKRSLATSHSISSSVDLLGLALLRRSICCVSFPLSSQQPCNSGPPSHRCLPHGEVLGHLLMIRRQPTCSPLRDSQATSEDNYN